MTQKFKEFTVAGKLPAPWPPTSAASSPRSAGNPFAAACRERLASPHVDMGDPKDIVRRGYDAVSLRYDEAYGAETKYRAWLSDLGRRIPDGGTVLDLGCGSGVPVARTLAAAGCRVTGIDISEVQIRRARKRVPQAEFIHADAATATFDADSFDAVVSFYSLIHLPLAEQPPLLRRIAGWLRPGG